MRNPADIVSETMLPESTVTYVKHLVRENNTL